MKEVEIDPKVKLEYVPNFCHLGDTLGVGEVWRRPWDVFGLSVKELSMYPDSLGWIIPHKNGKRGWTRMVREWMLAYRTKIWSMKKANLQSQEKMMVRWMCGVSLKDRKQSVDLYNFLGMQSVTDVVSLKCAVALQMRPMGLQWIMSIFKFSQKPLKNRVTVHKKSTNQASWIFSTSFALNSLNLTNPLACIHEPSFHLQGESNNSVLTRDQVTWSVIVLKFQLRLSYLKLIRYRMQMPGPWRIVNQANRFFVHIEARKANVYWTFKVSNDAAWNYEFFGIFNSKVPKHRHDSLKCAVGSTNE